MRKIGIVLVLLLAFLLAPSYFPNPPASNDVTELPSDVQQWNNRGHYVEIGGYTLFYIHEQCRSEVKNSPTFVILHGFPSSSYEYHKVFDDLRERGNVFVHDQLGFGLSDKPALNFTYSIAEAADNSLIMWRKAGLRSAHVVAHDMGDTILTEILARRHRGLLPSYFDGFFRSVTFTNGGMQYSSINFRISQTLLSNVYLGSYFCKLSNLLGISSFAMNKQLQSIWGPNADEESRDRDIDAINRLYQFKGGALIGDKTIYYLWDRAHFEFRWFDALSSLDLPTRLIWGDSDSVSPIKIPQFINSLLPTAQLKYIKGAGHFIMLERPKIWVELITEDLH